MSQMMTSPPTAIQPATAAGDWPWIADQGDGTFRNPILFADYSDPDVIRVGDDYFLTASSFNCTPGLPILHSRDLVNWKIIGHALKNLPHPRYAEVQAGCGVWAPSIRFHAGKYWIFFPMPDEGIYLTTAATPAGPWSEPHLVEAGKGLIDPCPLWDDDGSAYLVHAYAYSRSGIRDLLRVHPMAPDGSRLLGEGQIVFHSPERHPTLEGPKFFKKDGWYYLLAPAGGVAKGWQVALRSKDVFGPYEDRIVLEQGATEINGPHQGALLDSSNGEWWFAHFQDAGLYGRIVHLQPVIWKDNWPCMGHDQDGNGIGEPVSRWRLPGAIERQARFAPQTSDEFDGATPGLQWQWHANHQDHWWSLSARPGWLRLYSQNVAGADLLQAPNLISQKFPARLFQVETLLELTSAGAGEEAGLAVMGRTCAALALRWNGDGEHGQIVFRENGTDTPLAAAPGNRVKMRVRVKEGGSCAFSFAFNDGPFEAVPAAFQASAGVWVGAKVGLYSLAPGEVAGGHADFDYFRFSSGNG